MQITCQSDLRQVVNTQRSRVAREPVRSSVGQEWAWRSKERRRRRKEKEEEEACDAAHLSAVIMVRHVITPSTTSHTKELTRCYYFYAWWIRITISKPTSISFHSDSIIIIREYLITRVYRMDYKCRKNSLTDQIENCVETVTSGKSSPMAIPLGGESDKENRNIQ